MSERRFAWSMRRCVPNCKGLTSILLCQPLITCGPLPTRLSSILAWKISEWRTHHIEFESNCVRSSGFLPQKICFSRCTLTCSLKEQIPLGPSLHLTEICFQDLLSLDSESAWSVSGGSKHFSGVVPPTTRLTIHSQTLIKQLNRLEKLYSMFWWCLKKKCKSPQDFDY